MAGRMLKEALYTFCNTYVDSRISRIQKNIAGIYDSLGSETKSSAGDKHETGRAMLQLELEKMGQQLQEAEKMKRVMKSIRIENSKPKVGLGSLVYTSNNNYFIGISAGEFIQKATRIYCISAKSPIGKCLLGRSVEDQFKFNTETGTILKIL